MLAYVCIWLKTRDWSLFVRRARLTCSFMLNGALVAELIGIAKCFRPGDCRLPFALGSATYWVAFSVKYYMLFFFDRGSIIGRSLNLGCSDE